MLQQPPSIAQLPTFFFDRSAETPDATSSYDAKLRSSVFCARLVAEDPEMWLLKGGVALDYRLHEARSTLDLDLSSNVDITAFQEKLVRAMAIDLGDFFEVQFSGEPSRPVDEIETYRFGLDVRLNNRTFMKVSIDVGFADPWPGDADALRNKRSPRVRRRRASNGQGNFRRATHCGKGSRVYEELRQPPKLARQDLVDLVLLSGYRPIAMVELGTVLEAVFRTLRDARIPEELSASTGQLARNLPKAFRTATNYHRHRSGAQQRRRFPRSRDRNTHR